MPQKVGKYKELIQVRLTREQKEFVVAAWGSTNRISSQIRKLIDHARANAGDELVKLETRLAVIAPEYTTLKLRIEELKAAERVEAAVKSDKESKVEQAHSKLMGAFKTNHNQIDLIPSSYFKLYSDFCDGSPSPEELKTWLEGEIRKKGLA